MATMVTWLAVLGPFLPDCRIPGRVHPPPLFASTAAAALLALQLYRFEAAAPPSTTDAAVY